MKSDFPNGKKIGTFRAIRSKVNEKMIMRNTALGLILFFFATIASSQSVTITASQDNTLIEDPVGSLSDGAGSYLFVGRTNQSENSIRRTVIKFDLVGKIPENAVITWAKLTLNLSRTKASASNIHVHRLILDWGEGTSDADANEGSGAPSTTNDATWQHRFFNTQSWITPGGDFLPTASATKSVSGVTGFYTWEDTLLWADVVAWNILPSTNAGWIIIGDESATQTSKRFDSRTSAIVANRPKLIVDYTIPSTVEKSEAVPLQFILQQNFPNPFNPSTIISFSLSRSGSTSVKIFDVLGNEVASPVNQFLTAGPHTIKFNGSMLSSGIYFYRLQSGNLVATRKLMLVK